MSFNHLRIERTLQTLKSIMSEPVVSIPYMHVKQGDFLCPESARERGSFAEVSTPWHLDRPRERWWATFKVYLPTFDPRKEYAIEISTGREGGWDAVNPQLLAYVNGVVACGLDVNHRQIFLYPDYSGNRVVIDLHLFTGMQPGDILLRAKLTSRWKQVRETYYDMKVARDAMVVLPELSEARAMIEEKLMDGIYRLRMSGSVDEPLLYQLAACSRKLRMELYGLQTAAAKQTVHAVGHTHIDVAWLWDLRQTREKVTRSFATALDLQKRYPGYAFMSSQPVLHEMLEDQSPEVFERVEQAIVNGRWEPEGAMYLEADCNLTGGESFIRQIELGSAYFHDRFGVRSKVLWLPDVFGYSAALPQVLKGFDIDLFVTSKISWNAYNQLPVDSFLWEGLDGSRVPTQFITTQDMERHAKQDHRTIYEGNCTPSEVRGTVLRHQQRNIQPHAMMPYGYGDGGGGATEEMLETAIRLEKGLPGMPTFKLNLLSDFTRAFYTADFTQLPIWRGELYLEYHRGTYTTNGGIKQRHRQLEDLLIHTERLQVLQNAGIQGEDLLAHWRALLLNQFHDILPGTSIPEVYEEAYAQLDQAFDRVSAIRNNLVEEERGSGIRLYNTHGHSFAGPVTLPEAFDEQANAVAVGEAICPVQSVHGRGRICWVEGVPGLSSVNGAPVQTDGYGAKELDPMDFETPYYCVTFNEAGRMTKLQDKGRGRDLLKGEGGGFHLFEDRPHLWDAWDIDADYRRFQLPPPVLASLKVASEGPVATVLQAVYSCGSSVIQQEIYFYKSSRRIDFHTSVSWHEKHTLLRAEFDLNIHSDRATFDVQFGHVTRPLDDNHSYHAAMFEVCAAHWADLSEDDYGVALISNDKFGYSARGSRLGISLLKSPTWPDPEADQGEHCFTYSLLPHEGRATDAGVHLQALSAAVSPVITSAAPSHSVGAGWLCGLPENLVVESLRQLSPQVVELRLVEHYNRRGACQLQLDDGRWESVTRNKLNGDLLYSLDIKDGVLELAYKPFEIITLRLYRGGEQYVHRD